MPEIHRYDPIYADKEDIAAMIQLADDDINDDLMDVSCKNADATINARLEMHDLDTYEEKTKDIPLSLVTAGNYFSVSDIHQALDGTDDRSGNEEAYYNKALALLENYIQEQLDKLALTELKDKSPYGCSKSPSLDKLHIPY